MMIRSGIAGYSGYKDLFSFTRVAAPDQSSLADRQQVEQVDKTEKTAQKTRSLEHEYDRKKQALEQERAAEEKKLRREYQQEKQELEQEYQMKKRSLDISIYA